MSRVVGALFVSAAGLIVLLAHPGLYARSSAYWWVWVSCFLSAGWALQSPLMPELRGLLMRSVAPLGAAVCASLWLNGTWGNIALLELLSQLFLLWMSCWMARDAFARGVVARALVAGCIALGAYAFVQSNGLDPLPSATPFDGRRIVATFENPNYLGNVAACALPLLLALFFAAGKPYERLLSGLAVALIYGACILAGSRGAWLAGMAGTAFVGLGIVLAVRRGALPMRWLEVALLALALIAATYLATRDPIIANAQGKVSVGERLLSARYIVSPHSRGAEAKPSAAGAPASATSVQLGDVQVNDTTINHRYFIWRVAWAMVVDQPVVGVGYGAFAAHFPRYRDGLRSDPWYSSLIETQQYENTRYAHNEYLHLWAESGVLGLLAFIWLVGRLGGWLVGGLRRGASLHAWALVAALLAMLLHSLVSYPLRLPFNGLFFWVCLGIALGEQSEKRLKNRSL